MEPPSRIYKGFRRSSWGLLAERFVDAAVSVGKYLCIGEAEALLLASVEEVVAAHLVFVEDLR